MSDSDLIHVFVTFTAILILFSIGSNTLVIVSVLRFRKLRKVPNVLISNLAVSDILLAGLYIPQKLHDLFHTQNYYEGTFLCKFVNFVPVLLVTSSCYTLVCISFERCRAITTSHKPQVSMSVIRKVIVAIWILSFAIAFPTLLEYSTGTFHIDNQTNSNSTAAESILICSNQHMPKVFIVANGSLVLVLSFLIPLILVFCNYIRLAGFIHKRGRRIFSDRNKVRHATGSVVGYQHTMPVVASISGRMENVVTIPNFLENADDNQSETTNSNINENLNRVSSVQRKVEKTEQRINTTAQYSPNSIQTLTPVLGTRSTCSQRTQAIPSRATYHQEVTTPSESANVNQNAATSGSIRVGNHQTMVKSSRWTGNRYTVHNNHTVDTSGCSEGIDSRQPISGVTTYQDNSHTAYNHNTLATQDCSDKIDNQQHLAGESMRTDNYQLSSSNQLVTISRCTSNAEKEQQITGDSGQNNTQNNMQMNRIVATPNCSERIDNRKQMSGVSRRDGSSQTVATPGGSVSVNNRQPATGVPKRTRSDHTAAVTHLGKNRMRLVKMMMIVAVVYAISWIPFFVLYMYMKITGKDASKDVGSVVGLLLITMATFSTAYNVIVYVIFNQNFRQAFKNILKCTWNQLPSNHLSPS